jgi:tRNA 2-thiocytidine biosynthesis protein TtcA
MPEGPGGTGTDATFSPHAERLAARVRRTVTEASLIKDGDLVLMGISGGKDSLSLAYLLARMARSKRPDFALAAACVDWEEHPLPGSGLESLRAWIEGLGMPFRVIRAAFPDPRGAARSCYACARERKRLLFLEADRAGAASVALGHHRDDAAGTFLMNLLHRGRLEGMPPSRSFFGGKARIIRPLLDLPERSLAILAERQRFPVTECACPEKGRDARTALGHLMRRMENLYPGAKGRIARAGEKDRPPSNSP